MAEGKHSGSKNFGKVFQKTVNRTKEKVLQSLGKAEKTTDDEFDVHVTDFTKQQATALKLQKELKNYLQCIRAASLASKAFYETLRDAYEDGWTGHSEITGAAEALSAIWDDYLCKLTNQVQDPLGAYVNRFPDVKRQISKRHRKLTDYDGARHQMDSVMSQKKKDENKIQKAQEDLSTAKRIYEEMNTELHQDLPALYENRKSVLSNAYSNLFGAEAKFQEESAKIKNSLADVTERLNRESSDVFFKQYNHSPIVSVSSDRAESSSSTPPSDNKHSRKPHIPSETASNRSNISDRSNRSAHGSDSEHMLKHKPEAQDNLYKEPIHFGITTNGDISSESHDDPAPASPGLTHEEDPTYESVLVESEPTQNTHDDDDAQDTVTASSPPVKVQFTNNNNSKLDQSEDNKDSKIDQSEEEDKTARGGLYSLAMETDDTYSMPTNNEPVKKLPEGVVYQVLTTHPYTGDDTDELTFNVGELVNVLAYEDPEDQDDGWLMGIVVASGDRGVFPENFTKRI